MLRAVITTLLFVLIACGTPAAQIAPTSAPPSEPAASSPTVAPSASASAEPEESEPASPTAPTALTTAQADALRTALAVERYSYASYQQVLSDFGGVRPFDNIAPAEQQHVDAIKTLFTRYALAIPADATGVTSYASVPLACVAAAANEQQLVSTYDQLIAVTTQADILFVYRNLRSASLDNHLPAFTRC